MKNFESGSNNYENIASDHLSQQDVEEIIISLDDSRLSSDENVEHFIITHKGGKTFIPKRGYIDVIDESGKRSRVKIAEYLKSKLDELL